MSQLPDIVERGEPLNVNDFINKEFASICLSARRHN